MLMLGAGDLRLGAVSFFYQRRLFCILIIHFFCKAIQVCFLGIRAFENRTRHIIYPLYLLSREAGSDFFLFLFLALVLAGQVGKTRQWARQSIRNLLWRLMIIIMIALPWGDWWERLPNMSSTKHHSAWSSRAPFLNVLYTHVTFSGDIATSIMCAKLLNGKHLAYVKLLREYSLPQCVFNDFSDRVEFSSVWCFVPLFSKINVHAICRNYEEH